MKIIPHYSRIKHRHIIEIGQARLMGKPWISGVLLMTSVVIAMLLANLPATKEIYHAFLETSLSISIQSPHGDTWIFPKDMTVEKFINDILMVVFFFTVGLEIKREIVCGELSSVKKAMLPVIAAAGGMLLPALIYSCFNMGTDASSGWGIPTATDIAFAVGIMSILGDRVPVTLKIFLTALAIADDLGAILVVAFFYGGSINTSLLVIAILLLSFVFMLNKLGEKRMIYYLIPAIGIWFLFYYAGIHATMSGVVMAMMIPMDARYKRSYFERKTAHYQKIIDIHSDDAISPNEDQRTCLRNISHVARGTVGMSYRLEHALTPWVNFVIMPIFAIANAGVEIPGLSYLNFFQYSPEIGSVGLGIYFGLLLGKPVGITLASWIAIKLKVGEMPDNASWKMLFAVACLGGIGFTMSIFVDTLSFGELLPEVTHHLRSLGKIAVLAASLSAGILGSVLITTFSKKK
ncbi:MAG: Na+/H+ antiporter NhaA [Bacteroidales bacterium]|nr:Na+/H+ antiporter NhaA [Bacteroidales bacterium]